jgi:hypothetical protein
MVLDTDARHMFPGYALTSGYKKWRVLLKFSYWIAGLRLILPGFCAA